MSRTLVQKIFDSHLVDKPSLGIYALKTDLIMCHEITTPQAILDIKEKWGDKVFNPSKIVALIDHVNPAKDSATALQGKVIRDWSHRQEIEFYDVGCNGVCHALLPEQGYVRPGMTIICGDSHTCTAGAFGAFAAGVGTTDLEAAILKGIVFFREPKTMRIQLEGKLSKGVFAKDVILHLISQLGVKGATDHVIEFCGPIIKDMDMEGRLTVCNMVVEAGATSGLCCPDEKTLTYYKEHGITVYDFEILRHTWQPDENAVYDQDRSFGLSLLEPQVTFGNNPSEVKSISEMVGTKINQVYIGSCTNGRISDLRIAARILKGEQIPKSIRLIVVPATTEIQLQAIREGLAEIFIEAGAFFSGPTCGACLGMSNGVLTEGEVCASTTNRNFPGRMGKGGTVHLMSPATAAATALYGEITDPREVI
ncbi:MAG: 3-isopropylmalate dehydratase large subunit [Patescibacteria group bacterium]|nr:3-isopropylmalate dehydratase large subunit [Patescibacteria group bacterium]MBU1876802.1 3-isopropylmalate dehydratase large subunit [Patescibacteria group bacterium]